MTTLSHDCNKSVSKKTKSILFSYLIGEISQTIVDRDKWSYTD